MTDLQSLLGLTHPPVAIAFLDSPPSGVEQWTGAEVPAGCVFWKEAMAGKTFYTLPSHHYNCAVGAHTHHLPLPPQRANELEQTVDFMIENNYLTMAEVPAIPTLPTAPAFIAYGPADTAAFAPSVVIVTATPAQAMLLYEAAQKLEGQPVAISTIGRPGCASLPLALNTGQIALSLGCKGNRIFTGLPDIMMYLSFPGSIWFALKEQLAIIVDANQKMADHYQHRRADFITQ